MKRSPRLFLAAGMFGTAGFASAAVVEVPWIDPAATETFESVFGEPTSLFNGQVGVEFDEDGGFTLGHGWNLFTRSGDYVPIQAHSGTRFLTFNSTRAYHGHARFTFGEGVYQFGGYFSDTFGGNVTPIDRAFTQFDVYVSDGHGGETLAYRNSLDLISTAGELRWAGFASDVPITSVTVFGNQTPMDDLVIAGPQAVPEPASLMALGLGGLALRRRRGLR